MTAPIRPASCFAAFALALCACSSSASQHAQAAATAQAPSRHPESGLAVQTLTVTSKGRRHRFQVEVAATRDEQGKGLMFRTAMGRDEGMIFPRNPPGQAAFWMKNTVIPLDIIFIGTDGRILNIAANTVPYSETPVPSAGPVKGVLELNAGRSAQLGLSPGDRVEW